MPRKPATHHDRGHGYEEYHTPINEHGETEADCLEHVAINASNGYTLAALLACIAAYTAATGATIATEGIAGIPAYEVATTTCAAARTAKWVGAGVAAAVTVANMQTGGKCKNETLQKAAQVVKPLTLPNTIKNAPKDIKMAVDFVRRGM